MNKTGVVKALSFFILTGLLISPQSKVFANEPKEMNEVMKACKSDLEKYCNNVKPGEGRKMACLKAYEDKLSSECASTWNKRRESWHEHMKSWEKACGADKEKLCAGKKPEEMRECMHSHQSDLSPSCKDFHKNMKVHEE